MAEFSGAGEVRGNGSVYLGQFEPFTFNDLRVRAALTLWHMFRGSLTVRPGLSYTLVSQVAAIYLTLIDPGMLNEAA